MQLIYIKFKNNTSRTDMFAIFGGLTNYPTKYLTCPSGW